jgi:mono/diheme cytochrome c family protein
LFAQSPSAVTSANERGWQVPERAAREKSPLSSTPAVLEKGKELFAARCEKCHGPAGKGDGRYRDPNHPPADLSIAEDADGVMFYKVWNGRKEPLMPSFKTMMTKDEVWAAVAYAKSLRTP